MSRIPYSIRHGLNKNAKGFGLFDTLQLFCDAFDDLKEQGYTHEYFGFYCIDEDEVRGKISNIEREIKLVLRKSNLWPIYSTGVGSWKEDDLFDMMEFLYDRVSKPLTGSHHSYGDCGMHWVTFDAQKGKEHFVQKMNDVLLTYEKPFIMSADGFDHCGGRLMALSKSSMQKLPSEDNSVLGRV
ncbi:hypothetical protein [Variovorax sp. V512]|uniref:hypothetical protein n=1 Tax=Variovorax sp. V512 TaxID=3064160 RepID=UPI0032E6E9AD